MNDKFDKYTKLAMMFKDGEIAFPDQKVLVSHPRRGGRRYWVGKDSSKSDWNSVIGIDFGTPGEDRTVVAHFDKTVRLTFSQVLVYNHHRFPDETIIEWGERLFSRGLLDDPVIRREYQQTVLSLPLDLARRLMRLVRRQ